jgi:hypothetical protein
MKINHQYPIEWCSLAGRQTHWSPSVSEDVSPVSSPVWYFVKGMRRKLLYAEHLMRIVLEHNSHRFDHHSSRTFLQLTWQKDLPARSGFVIMILVHYDQRQLRSQAWKAARIWEDEKQYSQPCLTSKWHQNHYKSSTINNKDFKSDQSVRFLMISFFLQSKCLNNSNNIETKWDKMIKCDE